MTIAALLTLAFLADDWAQFRGPGGTGVSAEKDLPLEWGAQKNVRWRVALPDAGNGSPIVSKGRVFVTVAEDKGKKRSLLCIDRKTGKTLWTRTVPFGGAEATHADNPYCGTTPCADGERVVVWHSSAGAHCYDFEGKPLWSRDLGKFEHMWGYGASPVFHEDRVLLNCGPGERTFLVALDKRTGEVVWKHEEPGGGLKEWVGSWGTPVVIEVEGRQEVVVGFPSAVKGFDPKTGKVLWTCGGLGKLVYADVVVGNGVGVATGEDEAGDSIGFRLGGKGDVTATHRLWARPRALEVGTGLILGPHLWTIDNGGILRCTDAKTGEEVHKERLPQGAAWSSMISAAGRVYVTARSGETLVLQLDPKAVKILAANSLGEKSNSTPALSDGEIFLRTHKAIYCIRGQN
jgi:outer membrane protein assembly factor BamB